MSGSSCVLPLPFLGEPLAVGLPEVVQTTRLVEAHFDIGQLRNARVADVLEDLRVEHVGDGSRGALHELVAREIEHHDGGGEVSLRSPGRSGGDPRPGSA
ncbi:MAG: hypothetical protein M5T61_19730 [Acidimicrobiia bacterium]|nr:hypothetical protein [Acidimicrobiia bacterium]